MLKFFEKGPFAKWKFLQRAIQRHRVQRRDRGGGFKTFDTTFGPTKSHLLLDNDDSDGELNYLSHMEPSQTDICAKTSSFPQPYNVGYIPNQTRKINSHSKRVSSIKSRDDDESATVECPDASTAENGSNSAVDTSNSGMTHTLLNSEIPEDILSEKLETDGSIRRAYSDEQINWSDEEATAFSTHTEQPASKAALGSFDFRRSSKVRRSLREIRRRSSDHVDAVKEQIVRRINALKYSNMDAHDEQSDEEQEIVSYERSPGSKRRQVATAVRRSFRTTGKYMRAAITQSPSLSIGLGLAASGAAQKLTTTV